MINRNLSVGLTFAAALAFTVSDVGHAAAQQKKGGASKHQACVAKARAENPDRMDGRQREAAYKRCMGR